MDMMWYRRRGLMVTPHIESVTGTIASFNSDYNKIPIKSLICDIDPIQEGTGDPSPENVRPISGRTGLSVVRYGKNLLDDSIKFVTARGTSLYIGSNSTDYHLYLPTGTYNFSCVFASDARYAAYIKEENGSEITIWNKASGLTSKSFDLDGGNYRISFYNPAKGGGVSADSVSNIMLNVGDSALSYEPYKGNTYSVNWETEAGTVYGGTLDVVSGKLVVDRAITNVTAAANNGVVDGNQQIAFTAPGKKGGLTNFVSNLFKNSAGAYGMTGRASTAVVEFRVPLDALNVTASDSPATRVAAFGEWLLNNPTQLCYELATPTEIQLTPQEVKTLLVNNIWCDSGNVSVDYWKWGK